MDALQKLFLRYLMPFYCILLLYFINKLLRCFPNLPLANRSFHHALVTTAIISYASLIQTTFDILHPVQFEDGWHVFQQADVKYFGQEHLPYACTDYSSFYCHIPFPFVCVQFLLYQPFSTVKEFHTFVRCYSEPLLDPIVDSMRLTTSFAV